MIAKNDFLTFEYNGKMRHGTVENVRSIGERILFIIAYSEKDGDDWTTEYRSLYLDKCTNVRKSCIEEYLETVA